MKSFGSTPQGARLERIKASPRWAGERVYSRLYWNEAARGGHFAAFEQPAVFVGELRAAFRALPRGG